MKDSSWTLVALWLCSILAACWLAGVFVGVAIRAAMWVIQL